MAKGFGNMMKQAQKLQQQMMDMQAEIADKTVEGTSGGGMVRVVANGNQDILEVHIDPEVVDPEDVELLEDLIVAAITNAREKAKELMEAGMGKVLPGGLGGLGGMKLPGMG